MLSADFEGNAAEGLGIRKTVIEGLMMKTLFYLTEATINELAEQLCVAPYIVDGAFQRLRKDQLVQAVGLGASGGHRLQLTGGGRARAAELLSIDQYVGPVPVSLADYVQMVGSQSIRDMTVRPDEVVETFRDLVLDPAIVSRLGTAVISGRAIFLYGPPGTGKTTVAEKLADLFRKDAIYVPYAVEVDGQTITVFDQHVHERVASGAGPNSDNRWVRCHRPRLMVGGELTIDMLDLEFNPVSRFYTAPVQMRANNGFLIVDDFGRQRIPPAELLNRWVVPLDRRVDYLTMTGGKKLQIPFDLFVVFATNLDPATVIEEAFLRRIQTKINLGSITPEHFHEIFRRVCEAERVSYDAPLVDDLVTRIRDEYSQPLRACYPRDLVNQVLWRAKYLSQPAVLSEDSLYEACRAYFMVRGEAAIRE